MAKNVSKDTRDMIQQEEESMTYTMHDGEDSEYVYEDYDDDQGCRVPFFTTVIFLICIPLTGLLLYV